MKRMPNEQGRRDFGVFISLVMKDQVVTRERTVMKDQRLTTEPDINHEQTLVIYQISDRAKPEQIGQISRGEEIIVGADAQAKIIEKPKLGIAKGLASRQHLKIEWTIDGNILLTDLSRNGTWLNAELAQKLFPGVSFADKTVSVDRPLANLADWAPSATVLERVVSPGETVPMLQISGGKDGNDAFGKQIRLPGDRGWWNTVGETTQGVRIVPGILGIQENVFPQESGPVIILRREDDKIQVHQVMPNADPRNREPVIGSVRPGETLVVGRAPPETQNGQGIIVLPDDEKRVPSRDHFSIRWEIDRFGQPQGIILGDKGSTNGTFLFQREIAEIAEAVNRKAAGTAVGEGRNVSLIEAFIGGEPGNLKVVAPLLGELTAWVNSLGISINRDEAGELYDGETIVTDDGERYYLAVLRGESPPIGEFSGQASVAGIISPVARQAHQDRSRGESALPQKISRPTLFVEAGIISSEVRRALEGRYDVEEVQPTDAQQIIAQARLLQKGEQTIEPLKPILITTPGSDLDQSVRAVLLQEPNGGWNLPLAMVSVPRELLGQLTADNLLKYLLDLISRADDLPGRTDEQIRAFEQRSDEAWLLIQRA
jgi:hypothetical protein